MMNESEAKSACSSASPCSTQPAFLSLPDETWMDVVRWLPEVKDILHLAWTCRRLQSVIDCSAVRRSVIRDRKFPETLVDSWQEIAFYRHFEESGLIKENRIGFDFASTDMEEEDEDVGNNLERVEAVKSLIQAFPCVKVVLDAHCGVAGPLTIAPRFSFHRGLIVLHHLQPDILAGQDSEELHDLIPPLPANGGLGLGGGKIVIHPWGRRISDHMVSGDCNHPYVEYARQGKGWVELYLNLNGKDFPPRPSYYEGFDPGDHGFDRHMYQNQHIIRIRRIPESTSDNGSDEASFMVYHTGDSDNDEESLEDEDMNLSSSGDDDEDGDSDENHSVQD